MSVYKIYNKNNIEQFYIGSCKNFNKRKIGHKVDYKRNNNKLYQYIRNNGGWDNFNFQILQYCLNYQEREIELIKQLHPPLNTRLYNFNERECVKKYYQENRDEILKQHKKRYELNKDKIAEYNKKYNKENKDRLNKISRKYHEENKDRLNKISRKYYQENRDEQLKQKKIYYVYKKSWGGDERYNNNLLKI